MKNTRRKLVYLDPEENTRNRKKKNDYLENRDRMIQVLGQSLYGLCPIKGNMDDFTFAKLPVGGYVISNFVQEKLGIVRGNKIKGEIVKIDGDGDTYRDMWSPEKDTLKYSEDGFIV